MSRLFYHAKSFNGDISTWDVSNVRDMSSMFQDATLFNGYISKWEVSSVSNMKDMFRNAASFKQNLCGSRWVHSKAAKTNMFTGSFGSISRKVCSASNPASASASASGEFSPQSKAELKSAVDEYLEQSPNGDCPKNCPDVPSEESENKMNTPPLDSKSYFDTFRLPVDFDVNIKGLVSAYRGLQKKCEFCVPMLVVVMGLVECVVVMGVVECVVVMGVVECVVVMGVVECVVVMGLVECILCALGGTRTCSPANRRLHAHIDNILDLHHNFFSTPLIRVSATMPKGCRQ